MNETLFLSTLLLDVLDQWEEAYRLGRDRTPHELCPDQPGLHPMLIERIARRKQLLRLLESTPTPESMRSPDRVAELPGYDLSRELGRGGMGIVYEGVQSGLGRAVAVKMLAGMGSVERFRAESQALASLHHPNIVQVFEVGEHHGEPFMVLELLDGSLADVLREGPLSVEESSALLERLAWAVAHAHEAGILHRDLKPGNILLRNGYAEEGCMIRDRPVVPKVADFGLAKHHTAESGSDAPSTAGPVGTPSYMAPEQIRHDRSEIGPAVDVWALGTILYECLTGRPPFQAADFYVAYDLITTQDPVPPRRLNPKVPRDLETIFLKCLQKGPRDRYRSATELAEDLDRFRKGFAVQARRTPPWIHAAKWVRRYPATSALSVLVIVALLTALVVGWVSNIRLTASRNSERDQRRRAEQALAVARDVSNDLARKTWEKFRSGDQTRLPLDTVDEINATIAAYERLAELVPDDPETWETLGMMWFVRNRYDEEEGSYQSAVNALRRALELREADLQANPNDEAQIAEVATRSLDLGRAMAARGYADEAEPYIKRCAELRATLAKRYPDDRALQLEAANAHFEVAHFLYHLRSNPEETLAWSRLGFRVWEAALESSDPPKKGAFHYYDAKANEAQALRDLGRLRESLASWEVVLGDWTLPPRLRCKFGLIRGTVAARLGDHGVAVRDAKLADLFTEKFPELWVFKARTHAWAAAALGHDESLSEIEREKLVAEQRSQADQSLLRAIESDPSMTAESWQILKEELIALGINVPE